jgi:plasmid stabilization system protein ParE
MPQIIYTLPAVEDLIRLRTFLLEKSEAAADRARGEIKSSINKLPSAPTGQRPVPGHPYLRDLIIKFGAKGYIARYRYEPGGDVYILRIRHQLEAGYSWDDTPSPDSSAAPGA